MQHRRCRRAHDQGLARVGVSAHGRRPERGRGGAAAARDGPNELPVSRQRGVVRLAREVASEAMFLLLVACGPIYMMLGDSREALSMTHTSDVGALSHWRNA